MIPSTSSSLIHTRFSISWCGLLVPLLLRLSFPLSLSAAEEEGVLVRPGTALGFPPAIKIHITGFPAETAQVLSQDLLFMGFENGPENQAKFIISGTSGNGRVEGRAVEKINNHQVVGKAFTGPNQRGLIHALSDEIATTITGAPGIAQRKILFRVEPAVGKAEVYMADYDGFGPKPITQDKSLVSAPCWAGKDMIYYGSYKLGTPKIYYQQLSTGKRASVTPFPGSNISPAISPDGRRMAMILGKDGNPELYVADLNGQNPKRLTTTKESESSPCWSPDSQTIVVSSRTAGPSRLYAIPVGGGAMRPIVTRGVPNATEPDWSPDGKWIAFTTLVRAGFMVCIVPATGGDSTVLVEGEDPSWAANSRALIFNRGPDRGKKLSLLDVPSKQIKDTARVSLSNSQPSWAR